MHTHLVATNTICANVRFSPKCIGFFYNKTISLFKVCLHITFLLVYLLVAQCCHREDTCRNHRRRQRQKKRQTTRQTEMNIFKY